ncbi:MAG: pseudouridine-5'-phosphate glycosidase, partial [Candidatus Nanopelagicales bacterium]
MKNAIKLSREVSQALQDGTPVVALESTIVSHGLPRPENLRVARAVEETIRSRGAVPRLLPPVRALR